MALQNYHKRHIQVSGLLRGDANLAFSQAIEKTLSWANKRHNTTLPPEARQGQSFEKLIIGGGQGGSLKAGRYIEAPHDYWAFEYRHPCEQLEGRYWTTEITVARSTEVQTKNSVRFALRLNSVSPPNSTLPPLTTPGILRDLSENPQILIDGLHLSTKAHVVPEKAAKRLIHGVIDFLQNPNRQNPAVVITLPWDAANDERRASVDSNRLARLCFGGAHVFLLHSTPTYELRRAYGYSCAPFNGAVRVFNPGFTPDEFDSQKHPLYLPAPIHDWGKKGAESFENYLKVGFYERAARKVLPEADLPTYARVSNLLIDQQEAALWAAEEAASSAVVEEPPQKRLESPSVIVIEKPLPTGMVAVSPQLVLVEEIITKAYAPKIAAPDIQVQELRRRVATLEQQLTLRDSKISLLHQQVEEVLSIAADEERLRADAEKGRDVSEQMNVALTAELAELRGRFKEATSTNGNGNGNGKHAPAVHTGDKNLYPDVSLIADWAHDVFGDRLVFHSRAIAGAEKSEYQDPDLIYRGISLLGNEYFAMKVAPPNSGRLHDIFRERASLIGLTVGGSIRFNHAMNFGDTYFVAFNGGEKHFLNMHLARGQSRDARQCLRIYYAWDAEQNRVIIGHLPTHLDNNLS